MIKKLLKIGLAAVVISGLAFVAREKMVFGKTAYLHGRIHNEDENEKSGIIGAIDFLRFRMANPTTGIVDQAAVMSAYSKANANMEMQNKTGIGSNLKWNEIGPDNIGGRCRAIIIDKDSNNVIYAGGVTGGVFKSYDAGATWKKVGNNPVQNQNVVSLTQGADGAIYYGTGENGFLYLGSTKAVNNSAPGYYGQGVFKSTDHGSTFTQLAATAPTSVSSWSDVSCMAADPTDPNLIYAGNDNTLMRTTDGGKTWKAVGGGLPSGSQYICKDLKLTKDGTTMYVVMGKGSSPGGLMYIYRSTDKGTTFTQIGGATTNGVPTSSTGIVVAISPSQESTIYASVSSASNTFKGMYRSDNKGDTWTIVASGDGIFNPFAGQGFYDNCCAVDPLNPDKVYVAGLNIYSFQKTGTSIETNTLSDWSFHVTGSGIVNTFYVHADQHIILFDRAKPYPNMYIGTDGGVSKSSDVSNPATTVPTFQNADFGFNTTQFYGIGVGADDPTDVIGGSQDNGTVTVKQEGLTLLNGAEIQGGDGGYSIISKLNPQLYFAEYTSGVMYRSFSAGKSFDTYFDTHISPASGGTYSFIAWYSLWESANDPTSIDSVVFQDPIAPHKTGDIITVHSNNGVDFPYKLTIDLAINQPLKVVDPTQSKFFVVDRNEVWMARDILNKSILPTFFRIANIPGFTPLMIRSSNDGNTAFVVGTENGGASIYRISGLNGKVYAYTKAGTFDPTSIGIKTQRLFFNGGQVGTGVAIDENDANHVVMCTGTYDNTNAHIFASTNALDSIPKFNNVSGNMPSMPVYDILINSHNPKMYLAATELGIYSTLNSGSSWQEENNGMERVPVNFITQMKYSTKPWDGPYIFAATYGRGVFYSSTLTTGIDPSSNNAPLDKLTVNVYPNPVHEIMNVNVSLPKGSDVAVSIYNMEGRCVGTYNYSHQPAGENVLNVQMPNLRQGTYFVRVTADGVQETKKILAMGNN